MGMTWSGDLAPDDVPERLTRGAERGMDLALELILATARQRVPIEEGTLERSGAVARKGTHGVVSFDTPYAVRQHEDMSYRHDAGRQAKFLETALHDELPVARRVIAQQIRNALT